MIERVYRQASKELDEVVVATDDERIADAVRAFGGNVVMTSDTHRSGTDRCCEAYHKIRLKGRCDYKHPGRRAASINPYQIAALKQCFDSDSTDIATLVRPSDRNGSYEALSDPNRPKVVCGR